MASLILWQPARQPRARTLLMAKRGTDDRDDDQGRDDEAWQVMRVRLRALLAVLVALVWTVVVIDAVLNAHKVPVEVHGVFIGVLAAVFGQDLWRNSR